MKQPNRFIFRSEAVKHYLQSRERDVFPRLLSPFVFGFYWLLLSLLLLAMGIAWWGEVPVYAFGSGLLFTTTKTMTARATAKVATKAQTKTATKAQTKIAAKTTAKHAIQAEQGEIQALVFVPVIPGQPVPHLDTNTPILLGSSASDLQINGEVTSIDAGIVSPQEAKKRYKLTGNTDEIIALPSIVLHARIITHLPIAMYEGSIVHASIPNGSLRILSLLPGVTHLLGDGR